MRGTALGHRHSSPTRAAVAAAALASVLVVSGCSGDGSTASPSPLPSPTDSFPVTAPAPSGSAVLSAAPKRVAALDLTSADLTASLGGSLVGAPSPGFPAVWFNDQLTTTGLTPARYHEVPGLAVGPVAGLDPDLVLSTHDTLPDDLVDRYDEDGATVVSSPRLTAADWKERTREVGRILGLSGSAETLVADATRELSSQGTVYPDLVGKSFLVLDVAPAPDARIQVHTARSGQVQFLEAVGMRPAPAMTSVGENPDSDRVGVPAATAAQLDADVVVINLPSQRNVEFLSEDENIRQIPALVRGRGALVQTDPTIRQALAAATPNSFRWAVTAILPRIAEAAYRVGHPEATSAPTSTPTG